MNNHINTTVKGNNRPEYTRRYYIKKTLLTLRRGIVSAKRSIFRMAFLVSGIFLSATPWLFQDRLFAHSIFSSMFQGIILAVMSLLLFGLVILLLGSILPGGNTEHNFYKIGLTNALDEPPVLYMYYDERRDNARRELFIFYSNGVPLENWSDKIGAIENALGRDVTCIDYYRGKNLISVQTAPKGATIPESITWDDSLTPEKDFELLLGEGLTETVVINLNDTPHMLVGGSTGSGKTILIKTIVRQCLLKGALVVIADFKGGLDFPEFVDDARIITDRELLDRYLKGVVNILNDRKKLFNADGVANITEYNERAEKKIKRFVFVCDELAQVIDKMGATKSDKDEIDSIIASLSTVARLGRAFGINLVLGTQRPDATIVPGQIKNNADYRVCGYSPDSVLAEIILDNSNAVDILKTNMPRKIPGRFVDNMGVLFQGYYF